MVNKPGHRRFGAIRKLPSGRYQARYLGPDGIVRKAPQTYATKSEAERYLTLVEAQLMRGEWIDPDRGKIRLQDYAERWIRERANLRPRTVALYSWLLAKHVTPYLGAVAVNRITPPMVREWRARLLGAGVSQTTAAKAYRLLRAVLMTAVKEDELIRVNPCRIPGADQERTAERPVLTVPQVFALAAEMPVRFRAFVLLVTFASLRWGEASALQRQDVDVVAGVVRVRQAYVEIRGQGLVLGPPKSRAGVRTVAIPDVILPVVREHLDANVGLEATALVFAGPSGAPLWRGNFNKLVGWTEAVRRIGAPGLHVHDLRHTGNTLASKSGASLRDLMTRMGHDNPRAALIYQHRCEAADRAIADSVSDAIKRAQGAGRAAESTDTAEGEGPGDGTAGAAGRAG
jgi:integrase